MVVAARKFMLIIAVLCPVFLFYFAGTNAGIGLFESLEPASFFGKFFVMLAVLAGFLSLLLFCILLGSKVLKVFGWGEASNDMTLSSGVGFALTTGLVAIGGHLGVLSQRAALGVFFLVFLLSMKDRTSILRYISTLWDTMSDLFKKHPVVFGLLFIFLFFKWTNALVPLFHGDPLYYHLPSAWLWAKKGAFYYVDWLPWTLQGGISEYFYTYIALLTGNRFFMMILCQLAHVTFGYLLSSVIVYQISIRFMPPLFGLLAALCFATFPNETMMMVRAKNDGFVLFFSLLSIREALVYWDNASWKRLPLIYGAAWYAVSIKWSAAFFVIPFFTVFGLMSLIKFRHQWVRLASHHISWAFITMTCVFPIVYRNYIFTGNPFFPTFNTIFHSPYMNSYLEEIIKFYIFVSGTWTEIVWTQSKRFIFAKIPFVFALCLPFLRDARNFEVLFLWSVTIASFILVLMVTGQGHYTRFAFFLYALLSIGSMIFCWIVWKANIRKKVHGERSLRVYSAGVVLLIIANSTMEVPAVAFFKRVAPFVTSSETYASYFAKGKDSYLIHQWMNAHLDSSAKVLSFFDNECFFLDVPLSVRENQLEASEIFASETYEEATLKMKKFGFTHIQIPEVSAHVFPLLTENPRFGKDFQLMRDINRYRLYKTPF